MGSFPPSRGECDFPINLDLTVASSGVTRGIHMRGKPSFLMLLPFASSMVHPTGPQSGEVLSLDLLPQGMWRDLMIVSTRVVA